ncbi:hypothetical protein AVEN_220434-1 [Araneus ventricosus]|uniref:Uncharacterized protein n=1 Tax=Araneus ventricosus TaxID=182803 RepID=A0A4Y2IQE7_ARAVE|nr:hypothetical protein AVEN_220434-1 [Araneus ventricosus]
MHPFQFLLFITGTYRTTPTTALQSITEILPIYLRAQQESVYIRVTRLRRIEYFKGKVFIPDDFGAKDPYLTQHPVKFELDKRINLSPHNTYSKGITGDGSKIEGNAGRAFVALQDITQMHEWIAKLQSENSVFQAELLAIHVAII